MMTRKTTRKTRKSHNGGFFGKFRRIHPHPQNTMTKNNIHSLEQKLDDLIATIHEVDNIKQKPFSDENARQFEALKTMVQNKITHIEQSMYYSETIINNINIHSKNQTNTISMNLLKLLNKTFTFFNSLTYDGLMKLYSLHLYTTFIHPLMHYKTSIVFAHSYREMRNTRRKFNNATNVVMNSVPPNSNNSNRSNTNNAELQAIIHNIANRKTGTRTRR